MSVSLGFLHKTVLGPSPCLARAIRLQSLAACSRGLATTTQEIYTTPQLPPHMQSRARVQDRIERTDAHSVATLVQKLRRYLGTKTGINGTDVEVTYLKRLMAQCRPATDEWRKYGSIDPTRSYTRLHVDDVNGKCNLLFLVWNAGAESPIHNHADALCIMKIVKGTLNETVFNAPPTGPLTVQRDSFHGAGQVAFISDDIGVHRMRNPDQRDFAVSLHLYTPPHAADYGFSIYDQHTGHRTHMPGRIALSEPPVARLGL